MKKSFLVSIYVVLSVLGLVLMKLGGNTGNFEFGKDTFVFSISFISLIGFVSYIISFFLFTNLVVKFNLSYIIPITSGIIQVLTLFSGLIIFKENINTNGIIGVIMVISGIVIMNIKKNGINKDKKYVLERK